MHCVCVPLSQHSFTLAFSFSGCKLLTLSSDKSLVSSLCSLPFIPFLLLQPFIPTCFCFDVRYTLCNYLYRLLHVHSMLLHTFSSSRRNFADKCHFFCLIPVLFLYADVFYRCRI